MSSESEIGNHDARDENQQEGRTYISSCSLCEVVVDIDERDKNDNSSDARNKLPQENSHDPPE